MLQKKTDHLENNQKFLTPFWIPEFLTSNLNLKIPEVLKIYEQYFNENLENYERELEFLESEGIMQDLNRNIENFIYALHLLLNIIEIQVVSIEKNLNTVRSEVASKNILEECQKNIMEFLDKQSHIESLLFSCFVSNLFYKCS